jgi:hypothetical protein
MWQALNPRGPNSNIDEQWDVAFKTYELQLAQLLPRLNENAQKFFKEVSLHDAALTKAEFGDNIDSPMTKMGSDEFNDRAANVRMHATSAYGDRIHVLEYKGVTRLEVKFPGDVVLFPVSREANFGDWGYDELTEASAGTLRHEILFASGATILVEFSEIVVEELAAK